MAKPNGILAMNPEEYREIDGVVFDLASYARHCQSAPPAEEPAPAPSEGQAPAPAAQAEPEQHAVPAPAPVFAADPYHAGWYDSDSGKPPVPIMGGALPPGESAQTDEPVFQAVQDGTVTVIQTVWLAVGSGSGSYSTSYVTSYRTSWVTSGSGSGSGFYLFGSAVFPAGGYGLELI